MPIKAPVLALLALGAPLFFAASPALAADKSSSKSDDTKSDDTSDDTKKDDDTKKGADKDKAKPAEEDPNDPFEDPGKAYRFIGIRYRDAIVSKFMINWFANGGGNVNVPMVGPEFITRQNHLEIAVSVMYADYSMSSPFLFQGKSDGPTSWDLVQSRLKVAYAMVDILAEIPLEKKVVGGVEKTGRVALLIGGGVGVGGVFGNLYQSQAYPNNANSSTSDATQWNTCTSQTQSSPALASQYCSTRNTHTAPSGTLLGAGTFTQPNWINGGSLPVVYPWIALPQISLRYKPIKQFQLKADGGFSTSGFFFGASASYGL